MKWTVVSDRLAWDAGSVLTDDDLAGCNIDALVAGGHLSPAADKTTKRLPVPPVPMTPADEPEEQN